MHATSAPCSNDTVRYVASVYLQPPPPPPHTHTHTPRLPFHPLYTRTHTRQPRCMVVCDVLYCVWCFLCRSSPPRDSVPIMSMTCHMSRAWWARATLYGCVLCVISFGSSVEADNVVCCIVCRVCVRVCVCVCVYVCVFPLGAHHCAAACP